MSEQEDKAKEIARELGRRGGTKTFKKYGREHYRKAVKKRWDRVKKEKEEAEKEALDK